MFPSRQSKVILRTSNLLIENQQAYVHVHAISSQSNHDFYVSWRSEILSWNKYTLYPSNTCASFKTSLCLAKDNHPSPLGPTSLAFSDKWPLPVACGSTCPIALLETQPTFAYEMKAMIKGEVRLIHNVISLTLSHTCKYEQCYWAIHKLFKKTKRKAHKTYLNLAIHKAE